MVVRILRPLPIFKNLVCFGEIDKGVISAQNSDGYILFSKSKSQRLIGNISFYSDTVQLCLEQIRSRF